MFDPNSVPQINIEEDSFGSVKIKKVGNKYYLYVNEAKWMVIDTDSLLEVRQMYGCYDLAKGDVILSGFGFGILAQWIASKESVKSVTVVEFCEDVVSLFKKHNTLDPKINIVISDIRRYTSDKKYDWAIFDHYEDSVHPSKEELDQLSKNIDFTNLWFWSLELHLFNYDSWSKFRDDYSLKIPDISLDKLSEYMECIFNTKDFSILKQAD